MDDLQSVSYEFDKYLTVKGLLCTHYGLEHGEEIYELLSRSAKEIADMTGGSPGIIFNQDGGEFVGLEIKKED